MKSNTPPSREFDKVAEAGKQNQATLPTGVNQTISRLELLPLIESILKSQPVVCTAVVTFTFKIEPTIEASKPVHKAKEDTSESHTTNPQDVIWQF